MTPGAGFDRNFGRVMPVIRNARRACLCFVMCALPSCKVYDRGLVTSESGATPDAHVSGDAGTTQDACVAALEICNDKDDDCDGKADETEAAQRDCMNRIAHAGSFCKSGLCAFLGECDPGYFNCDGRPENGCESNCACNRCMSTDDDGGADAGN